MVVRGRIRGNGQQLASYLLKKGDNDNVRVFDIAGTMPGHDLHRALIEMSLTSELTRTDKGLYHVQICPAYGEDRRMTDADWLKASDIMEQETGFTGQKRAIVLHEKKGRVHAHVVWERYDHNKGIMKPNRFSRLAQDRARMRMEKELEQMRTPERNTHRPEMKAYLTKAWHDTEDAAAFQKAIAANGYIIAAGTQRPYMVVDETGRSFDLVRQLTGVKTKEVRERIKETKLAKEKEVISEARAKHSGRQHAEVRSRDALKAAANDNVATITDRAAKPATQAPYRIAMTFTIEPQAAQQASHPVDTATAKTDDKEAKKLELLAKLRKQRLEKAKEYRDNERDVFLER